MGGCAPSKMPNGEEALRKNSKFGFKGGASTPSLNASETRLKHLAVTDDTYEIVRGGRLVGPTVEQAKASAVGVLDVMRDAGSQTLIKTTPDTHLSRPTQFPAFGPKTGSRLTAPLATIETASELGTPTPMEENKAFIRLQPGQQRPLLPFYGSTPARFGFSPKVPFHSSPSPVSTPTSQVTQPANQKLKAPVRPSGLSPRAPPTSLFSPSPQIAGGTDNVMISTASFAMKPQSASTGAAAVSNGSVNSVKSAEKESISLDNVRTSSSATQKLLGEPVVSQLVGQKPLRTVDRDHKKVTPVTDDTLSLKKPTIPKPGTPRTPLSVGNAPRGPLASQQTQKFLSDSVTLNGPAKPARKSPQSQSGTTSSTLPVASSIPDTLLTKIVMPKGAEFGQLKLSEKTDSRGLTSIMSTRTTNPISMKFAVDECDSGSDIMDMNHVLDDDDSIFSEREALAEMPRVHRITQAALEDMLGSLQDVRTLADSLLKLQESTSKVLLNGHGDEKQSPQLKENGTVGKFPLSRERLEVLVRPPDEAIFENPLEARQLILDLQEAVLMLCDCHYSKRSNNSAF